MQIIEMIRNLETAQNEYSNSMLYLIDVIYFSQIMKMFVWITQKNKHDI